MLKIVLADDHRLVRKGLAALLGTEPDFMMVGEAENGLQALQLVERLQPDILVLDLMMPVMSGLEVTRSLLQRSCRTGIVILSMHSDESYIFEALRLGAQAYILKEAPPEELIKGIREVAAGRRYLDASLKCKSVEEYVLLTKISASGMPGSLTDRE